MSDTEFENISMNGSTESTEKTESDKDSIPLLSVYLEDLIPQNEYPTRDFESENVSDEKDSDEESPENTRDSDEESLENTGDSVDEDSETECKCLPCKCSLCKCKRNMGDTNGFICDLVESVNETFNKTLSDFWYKIKDLGETTYTLKEILVVTTSAKVIGDLFNYYSL